MITRAIIVIAGAIAILFTVASHARADTCTQPMTTICTTRMCFPMTPTCNKCTAESICTRDDGTVYVKAIDDHAISGTFTFTMEKIAGKVGMASWYGYESGTQTASGQRFNPKKMTCAMRTHKWRWVTVTVIATGKSARCWVNDYGPAKRTRRLIDVAMAVAEALDFKSAGTARVRVE